MLTLHHLNFSRSLRVLWLLEELGIDYNLVNYARTAEHRAPPELSRIHPLGKAPVIVDGDLTLAESSTILRYIHSKYGNQVLMPRTGTNEHAIAEEWLDYSESSAALPIMLTILGQKMGGLSETMGKFAEKELTNTLDYIASGIRDRAFLMGEHLTLADIQISYLLVNANDAGMLSGHPVIASYVGRLQQQPGYLRATAVGGEMVPPSQ